MTSCAPASLLRLAALTAIVLLGPAQAATVSFDVAASFSAVTFGSFTGINGDTERPLAAGGAVRLTNWGVNTSKAPGFGNDGYSLIVGGSFDGKDGSVAAPIGGTAVSYMPGTDGIASSFDAGTVMTSASTPIDFAVLRTRLVETSAALRDAAVTGTAVDDGASTLLTGSSRAVEVFAIDGAQLTGNTFLSLQKIAPGATAIFNVSGAAVQLAGFGFDLGGASNVLFNFYEATSLGFDRLGFEGSVLAPLAAVTGSSGYVAGNFVAQSFASAKVGDTMGGFEFHHGAFASVDVMTAVPEPPAWLLAGAGLLLLGGVRRRVADTAGKPFAGRGCDTGIGPASDPDQEHVMAKYGEKAQEKVGKALHEEKKGTLKSGTSGKKVTSRKQAIAIGLSEARKEGGKVPARRTSSRTGH